MACHKNNDTNAFSFKKKREKEKNGIYLSEKPSQPKQDWGRSFICSNVATLWVSVDTLAYFPVLKSNETKDVFHQDFSLFSSLKTHTFLKLSLLQSRLGSTSSV